jgi:hypothetical protein
MKIILFIVLTLGGYLLYQMFVPPFDDTREAFSSGLPIRARVAVSGTVFPISFDAGLTVAEALGRAGFHVTENDQVYPALETLLLPGTSIWWQPARSVRIVVDGGEKIVSAIAKTSEGVVAEAGIALDDDDIVVPAREMAVSDGMKIAITRVEIREETKEIKIPFATKAEEDDKLSWRKKIVTQKGEYGIKKIVSRVSYHNGKEVNRKTISTEVSKEPVIEIVTQGTDVKTGKSHRGAASWYAWTGTMAAANPWLPKGSYVRVTNLENSKSVIVVINDRGPFVPGRIIDLDRVAFEKIASVGAGVINVKMEEIVN